MYKKEIKVDVYLLQEKNARNIDRVEEMAFQKQIQPSILPSQPGLFSEGSLEKNSFPFLYQLHIAGEIKLRKMDY